jgi:hypothetical protein
MVLQHVREIFFSVYQALKVFFLLLFFLKLFFLDSIPKYITVIIGIINIYLVKVDLVLLGFLLAARLNTK